MRFAQQMRLSRGVNRDPWDVLGLGFRIQSFGVLGLGFRGLGFRVLGFRVWGEHDDGSCN